MRKTKLETGNSKLETGNSKLDTLFAMITFFPIFVFRVSIFVFTALWRWLRAVSGEADYERYRAARPGDTAPLSPGEFYRQTLERKYSRPCRCC